MTGRARNPHHVIADISYHDGAVECSCGWQFITTDSPAGPALPDEVAEAYRQHRLAQGLALPGPPQANRVGVWR